MSSHRPTMHHLTPSHPVSLGPIISRRPVHTVAPCVVSMSRCLAVSPYRPMSSPLTCVARAYMTDRTLRHSVSVLSRRLPHNKRLMKLLYWTFGSD